MDLNIRPEKFITDNVIIQPEYGSYITGLEEIHIKLGTENKMKIIEMETSIKNINNFSWEKYAAYIYTTNFYKNINPHLRNLTVGGISYNFSEIDNNKEIIEIINILHNKPLMTVSGINNYILKNINKYEKVYRGITNSDCGDVIFTNTFISTSLSYDVALDFALKNSSINLIIEFNNVWGSAVSTFSEYPEEQEILMPFGLTYKVFEKKYLNLNNKIIKYVKVKPLYNYIFHHIKKNETLEGIKNYYNLKQDINDIINQNGIKNKDRIYINQILILKIE